LLFAGTKERDQWPDRAADWYIVSPDKSEAAVRMNVAAVLRESGLSLFGSSATWAGGKVYFAAYHGEPSNLWSVSIRTGLWKGLGTVQQLTSAATIESEPWAIADGTVAFTTLISSSNIFATSLSNGPDRQQRKVTGANFTITSQPSCSRDGQYLAFRRKEANVTSIVVRDMTSGNETVLSPSNGYRPVVSPDGNRVAFSQRDGTKEPIWIYDRRTGETRQACANCGMVLDWTPDLNGLLYSQGGRPKIYWLDLQTGRPFEMIASSEDVLLDEFRFSPDGGHLAFVRQFADGRREIVIAAVNDRKIADTNTWISLDNRSFFDNNPRWSPDGGSILFMSRRDSYDCIWRVKLDGKARPASSPEAVQHLHQGRLSTELVGDGSFQLAAGGNEVFYNLGEVSSTIWAVRPPSASK
jgi:dipeptidyl aminopeptidase/acylaminoacyl peptidase